MPTDKVTAHAHAINALLSLYHDRWDPWLGKEPAEWETHKEEITSQVRWNLEQVIPKEDVDFYVTRSLYGTSYDEWLAGWLRGGIELAARDCNEERGNNTCNRRDKNRLPMALLLCIAVSALTTILTKCVIAFIG